MVNVTVAPREHATPVEDPAIPEARSLRTGKILDAKRLISAFLSKELCRKQPTEKTPD